MRTTRAATGQPLTRWSVAHLRTALDLAVRGRGWPAEKAGMAMLHVAADPGTRSPARLAGAGPWWDDPADADAHHPVDVSALDAELNTVAGLRVQLQRSAREQLADEGRPLTRVTVLTRAVELLHANDR